MNDHIGFILFSMIEGLGIYAMMLSIFRFNPWRYFNNFMLVLPIMVLQSLFLREIPELVYLVPVISILLFVFFLRAVLKIPIVWSTMITLGGYVGYGLIQWAIIEIGFGSVEAAQSGDVNGYIVQTATAAVQLVITYLLLKYRIGFTFSMDDYDKLRLKYERVIVIILIVISIVGLALVAVTVKAIPIVIVSFVIFLYFMVRKEKEES
ncbi:hypothetical protein AB4Z21_32740 [Paenibacillus sp. MCAF20]